MTAKIIINGSQCKLLGALSQDVMVNIDRMCSYKPEGIEYSEKVKKDEWDGIIHLFRNRHFPIGLLQRVQMYLMVCGIEQEVVDNRRLRSTKIEFKTPFTLRDYQERVVTAAIAAERALIPVSVGGGKTIIAAEIIARLGLKTLFITPAIEILEQTRTVLHEGIGLDIGLIHEKTFEPRHVTITTWQTLHAKLKRDAKDDKDDKLPNFREYLSSVDVVVFDETHHVASDKIFEVAMHLNAIYRYGLSGSLFRTQGDEVKYYGAIGEALPGVTASELIDLGYLVPPKIKFIQSLPMPFGWRDKWRDVYDQGVVNNRQRNGLIVEEARRLVKDGRVVLVLVNEVEHGKHIKTLMPEAEFVFASAKERRDIVDRFRAGKIPCLISSPIFDEGVDITHITAIILAGAGKSQIKAVQRVGRGLRTCPEIGKKDVVIIDFNDPMKYLWEHSQERYSIYKRERRFGISGELPGGM